ncbi:MAG: hypothetical protein J7578_05295 [Chitinophagaceae bacterium]|nr:hypothetical protein [Chitinophagaceae bacterium]
MKTILWGLLCALSARSVAQIIRPSALQPMHAVAYNQQFADIFSCKINPAALGTLRHFQAGAYVEKKYLLQGLRQYSIIAAAPTAAGGWSFSMDYSGLASYRQWESSLAWGRKLGKLSIGAQVDHAVQHAGSYGNKSWFSAGLSSIWQLSPVLSAGWQLFRLTGRLLSGTEGERPAYGYSAGLGLQIAPGLLLETRLIKNEGQASSVLAGIHYKADERLVTSCLLDLTDTRPSMRVKWLSGNFQLGVTGSYHPLLGFSPGVLLIVPGVKKGGL